MSDILLPEGVTPIGLAVPPTKREHIAAVAREMAMEPAIHKAIGQYQRGLTSAEDLMVQIAETIAVHS